MLGVPSLWVLLKYSNPTPFAGKAFWDPCGCLKPQIIQRPLYTVCSLCICTFRVTYKLGTEINNSNITGRTGVTVLQWAMRMWPLRVHDCTGLASAVMWDDTLHCQCEEMKWRGVFPLIFLLVTEPSKSETQVVGVGGAPVYIDSTPTPPTWLQALPHLRLYLAQIHLPEAQLSPSPFLLRASVDFSSSIETYSNDLPGVKDPHAVVLLFIPISLTPHFPLLCFSWSILFVCSI